MSTWSKTNIAHRRTYIALRILEETKRKFSSAGNTAMDKLDFWVPGDSADIRKGKARSLASRINNLFVKAYRSKFEDGFTKVKSINQMTAVLTDSSKKVLDLAEKADECYDFYGEDDV